MTRFHLRTFPRERDKCTRCESEFSVWLINIPTAARRRNATTASLMGTAFGKSCRQTAAKFHSAFLTHKQSHQQKTLMGTFGIINKKTITLKITSAWRLHCERGRGGIWSEIWSYWLMLCSGWVLIFYSIHICQKELLPLHVELQQGCSTKRIAALLVKLAKELVCRRTAAEKGEPRRPLSWALGSGFWLLGFALVCLFVVIRLLCTVAKLILWQYSAHGSIQSYGESQRHYLAFHNESQERCRF